MYFRVALSLTNAPLFIYTYTTFQMLFKTLMLTKPVFIYSKSCNIVKNYYNLKVLLSILNSYILKFYLLFIILFVCFFLQSFLL